MSVSISWFQQSELFSISNFRKPTFNNRWLLEVSSNFDACICFVYFRVGQDRFSEIQPHVGLRAGKTQFLKYGWNVEEMKTGGDCVDSKAKASKEVSRSVACRRGRGRGDDPGRTPEAVGA